MCLYIIIYITYYIIILYYILFIILYYIILHCIVLYCIILYYIIFFFILYCIVLYCIILYYIILYYIISYYIILYYIILYCIILYYITLYYIILYYIIILLSSQWSFILYYYIIKFPVEFRCIAVLTCSTAASNNIAVKCSPEKLEHCSHRPSELCKCAILTCYTHIKVVFPEPNLHCSGLQWETVISTSCHYFSLNATKCH